MGKHVKERTEEQPLRAHLGYISESEFFSLIGIAKGTGRNRQSAGTLPPHYKLGREKLYKLSEVEAWIIRRRVTRAAGVR